MELEQGSDQLFGVQSDVDFYRRVRRTKAQ